MVTSGLAASEVLPLDGEWRFALDRNDSGEAEEWYVQSLKERIQLPGDLSSQGIGDPVNLDTPWIGGIRENSLQDPRYKPYQREGNFKIPFWLQPDTYYKGAAWYQREVEIPKNWIGQRLVLHLERPHWKTTVWLDDQKVGSDVSLATPHEYDLGLVEDAGLRTLTIRVDNSMVIDVGHNSHSVSDHTQGNWNGIVGKIQLEARSSVWLENIRVFPDVPSKRIQVKAILRNASGKQAKGKVSLDVVAGAGVPALNAKAVTVNFDTPADGEEVQLLYSLGKDAQLWSEFSPAVYFAELSVGGEVGGRAFLEESRVAFGLRKVSRQGGQLMINDRKLFLRGTLECAIFPKTGHPPTDVESWRKVYRAAQAHGLNHIRFHSWCPPEAAFVAADEMGVYLQPEASSWPNQSTRLGEGKPVDEWLEAESKRVLEAYGNHPSFILMASGNEPGGPKHEEWLSAWLIRRQQEDPRRLYTSASGWPELDKNDFHVTPRPRIQQWGEGLASRINAQPPETYTDYRDFINERKVPVVSHEIGQWCVYPNFEEIEKYTGYLKPKNFEIFRDWLEANHMGDQARDFLMASGKLQALCYKEDIESALRTASMGGFQLLDLHDFPGQGTALVGILDPFWEEKGYISPEAFKRFCDSVVPLARLEKRVFTTDERLHAQLELSHYGESEFKEAIPVWRLVDAEDRVVKQGSLSSRNLPPEGLLSLGKIELDLADLPAPAQYTLELGIRGTDIVNGWNLWVYPQEVPAKQKGKLTVVRELDKQAEAALRRGGTVLLQLPPGQVQGDVKLGFSSIFWNTAWTDGQAPHSLGILCDPTHPAFADFPTNFHSDWQWWYVISHAAAMVMDGMPPELRPIVQVVDDWFQARRLGLVFEAKVGKGRLLVTSIDLDAQNPVVSQLRSSLFGYLNENPEYLVEVGAEKIKALYE